MVSGSVQQKNGKYYAVLNLKDENGKRKQKWISTGLTIRGNKKKAEQFLKEKELEYSAREGLISSDILFSVYLEEWLKERRTLIDPVTYNGYQRIIDGQINPYFAPLKMSLKDVTTDVLQKFVNDKAEKGKRVTDENGKIQYVGLAPKTIKNIMMTIKTAFKDAIKKNLVLTNPCVDVKLPKITRRPPNFYTYNELQNMFIALKGERLFPLIYCTAILGLRRSEVLGLKWDSINLETNEITVKHTVVSQNEVFEKDKTKTDSSYRTYPMTKELEEMFISLKAEEEENRKLFGKAYIENKYIFKQQNGKTYLPDYVTKKFSKLLEQHNLKHIRFHDLRHSCASILIAKGFRLKDIQEWLGHADIKTTANVYGHIDIERKNKIADLMSNTFSF